MINEPDIDLVQNEKRWNKVYFTAIIASLIFSVGVILGEFDFSKDEINQRMTALYISMCAAYLVLSITYIITIIFLHKNMLFLRNKPNIFKINIPPPEMEIF